MGFNSNSDSSTSMLSNNTKVLAHEAALQQTFISFKDLVLNIEQLQIDSENYKGQYLSLKEKCENKNCSGVEELKKVVATKDLIIQSVASILTKLDETKNFNVLAEAFKIIFEEASPLTPPIDNKSPEKQEDKKKSIEENVEIKQEGRDESVCEIEGTPTGKISPILNTKKNKTSFIKSSDFRDKKKCPDDWPTPESKTIKLIYPCNTPTRKGTGKLRQTRLDVVTVKHTTTVDLTAVDINTEPYVQPLIKKESIENDDTILPSPTSGPTNFSLLKSTAKPSPNKFKKPLSLKNKTDKSPKQDENVDIKQEHKMDESINILNPLPKRLRTYIPDMKEESPIKIEPIADDDGTNCEDYSILLQIDKIEADCLKENNSPVKQPLATNINIMNTPPKEAESSMSILRTEIGKQAADKVKRKLPEPIEPIYKEPAVRNKAEKRALPGWSCEECKNFYGALYKDDPVMLALKIKECSKHRGRHNPQRPKTPPNYWNPRWTVPEDTEELNRMNNAT